MRVYLKGIDGLRAVCALIILLGHIPAKTFSDWSVGTIPLPVCCAYVFFVISGFLAGSRMDYMISPCDYLKKKAKRILPLYYSYILVSILVFVILNRSDEVLNPRMWYYLFLLPSIPFCESNGIVPLVHLWFIGTLLFFYLVFPLYTRMCRGKQENRAVLFAGVICIVWFCIKMACRFFWGNNSIAYRIVGVTCYDVLFLGVLGGLLWKNRIIRLSKYANIVTAASWILLLLSGFYGRFIPAPIRVEFIAIVALGIILGQQESSFVRIMDNKLFRWLASISYEIYITQILVIIVLSSVYTTLNFHFCDSFVYMVSVVCVLICSQIWKTILLVSDWVKV